MSDGKIRGGEQLAIDVDTDARDADSDEDFPASFERTGRQERTEGLALGRGSHGGT